MVTLLKNVGNIGDVEKIKQFLFNNEEDQPHSWFDLVQYSLSSSGAIAAILFKNKLIILKVKEPADAEIEYEITYQGILADFNSDNATFILSLSVALQQKSVGTTTQIKTSIWNCIAVGFSSGYFRIYTETGIQLFEQIFHPKPITSMKYCHPKVLQDELLIVYPDILVAVDGFSLYQCLRFCRMQQSRTVSANSAKNLNISFKKWLLQDQAETTDVEFYGVRNTTPFEHLFQASLAGGSSNYIGNAGLGPVYNYLAVGRGPFIAQYCPSEQSAQPIMSEVVMSVATKLMSYIPGSSWLSGWAQTGKEGQATFEPPIGISKNICIDDPRRDIISVKASPRGNLAVLADTFGRLLLLDVASMILVNIWKGYRDAQCGWLLVPSQKIDSEKPQNTLFLVIYAKKRGILEVWCPYQHYRVAAFNVGKKGILISNMFSALGEGSLSSPLLLPPWRPAKSCCFLFQDNGDIMNISVPFESCFGLEYMLSIEDQKLLDKAHNILGKNNSLLSVEDEQEFEKLIFEIQLASNITDVICEMQQASHISAEFKLRISKAIVNEIALSKELYSQPDFVNLHHKCKIYVKLSFLYVSLADLWKSAVFLSSSVKSPTLSEVQEVIELYFGKANIDSSFDPPDCVLFQTCFYSPDYDTTIVHEPTLKATPPSEARANFVKFLTLPFLYAKHWENMLDLLMQTGLSLSDIFTIFVEACLSLDIQLSSQEYQVQISKVIRHFLSNFESPDKLWNNFFNIVKSHTNVCHGLILAIYCQNVAVDTLEFTSVKFETNNVELEDDKTTEGCVDDQEWVALTPEHEKWYTARQQLWDVLHLQINTNVTCTVNTLLNSSNQTVTHVVANFIIDNELIQNFIDWVERCRNHASDDGDESDNDNEIFDDTLSWLLNVVPWWPYQLDPTTISVCLLECLIFRWSEVLDQNISETDVSHLVSASKVLLSLKSISVQQSLLIILWETVFSTKLKKLYFLIEKIGRQPKDRVCAKELSVSLQTILEFVSIARHILVNVNISANSKEDKFLIKQENVWASDNRHWLLHKCIGTESRINHDIIVLHAQLVTSLELIISLNIKNVRPSILFHSKYSSIFFTPLTSTASIKFSTTPDIDILHEQMLKMCVKSSVSSELEIFPYQISWNTLIINLATLWECAVPIQSYMAVFLYSLGKFEEADEIVLTSSHRQALGLQLLDVLLSQLEMQIYLDETSQKLFLPLLTPSLSTWLRSKRDPNVAMIDIKVVFKTFSNVLTWIVGDDQVIQNSKELRGDLVKLL